MAEKIIMPQGGQDITEGRVIRWHKAEGDPVNKDEVICEVETEKAVFEVKSPLDGVLLKIVVPAGKVVRIFSIIGFVGAAAGFDTETLLSGASLGDSFTGVNDAADDLSVQIGIDFS